MSVPNFLHFKVEVITLAWALLLTSCASDTETVARKQGAFGLTGLDYLKHFLKCLVLRDIASLPSIDLSLGRLKASSRTASLHSTF